MKGLMIYSVLFLVPLLAFGQSKNANYEKYIKEYSDIAIIEMERHRVPASITLAQGLLESGAGQSRLAKEANNHFGIKCGSNWNGRTIKHHDDSHNECFRVYDKAIESFEDHSLFLKRDRYSFLFDYNIIDYTSWAYGLRSAGYATDPKYPEKLIRLIELYQLHEYDKKVSSLNTSNISESKKVVSSGNDKLFELIVVQNNGVDCVRLISSDNIDRISKELGISTRRLLKYNDMPEQLALEYGDYVYIAQKKNSVKEGPGYHIVGYGESLHSISQMYGIKLSKLCKLNNLSVDSRLQYGQSLNLR